MKREGEVGHILSGVLRMEFRQGLKSVGLKVASRENVKKMQKKNKILGEISRSKSIFKKFAKKLLN